MRWQPHRTHHSTHIQSFPPFCRPFSRHAPNIRIKVPRHTIQNRRANRCWSILQSLHRLQNVSQPKNAYNLVIANRVLSKSQFTLWKRSFTHTKDMTTFTGHRPFYTSKLSRLPKMMSPLKKKRTIFHQDKQKLIHFNIKVST